MSSACTPLTGAGRKFQYGLLSAAAIMAATAPLASAATLFTWETAPTTNNWSTAAGDTNWNAGVTWADVAATPNNATFNTTSGSQTVNLVGTIHVGTLTFQAGGWSINGGTALTGGNSGLLLTIANTGTNTINSIIGTNGTTPLTISGSGTLILGGANTYSGLTTISGTETVQLGATGNLGAGGLTFTAGGTFDLNGRNQSIAALTSASGFGTVTNSAAGTSTLALTGATSQTFSGTLQNGSPAELLALTINGSTNQILTGNSTYTGSTTIVAGKLTLSGNGTGSITSNVDVQAGATLAIDSSANTTATSFTRLAGVTLDNATMTNVGNNTVSTNTAASGALTLGSGLSTYTGTAPTSPFTSTMTFGSLSRVANGGVGRFFLARLPLKFTTAPTFVGSQATSGTAIGVIPYAIAQNNPNGTQGYYYRLATYDATNGLRPLAAGEMTAASAFTAGQNVLDLNVTTTLNSPVAINSLTMNAASSNPVSIVGSGTLTISSGAILMAFNGVANDTISVATLDFGSVEGIINSNNNNLTINSAIMGSGGLTKAGTGLLTLNNNNSGLSGQISLYGGTTFAAGDASLGNTGTNSGIVTAGTTGLEFTAATSSARSITTSDLGTLSLVTDTGTNNLTGVISGNSGLAKLGAGNLVLNQAETYSGATTLVIRQSFAPNLTTNFIALPAGALTLAAGGSLLNSSSITVGSTGALVIDSSGEGAGPVARGNNLNVGSGGSVTVNGNSANSTTDTFGGLGIGTGGTFASDNVFTVHPGAGQTSTVQFSSLSRTGPSNSTGAGSTINFVGPNFGQAAGSNVAEVIFTTAPTLQNSGAGATQIIPYAVVTDTATGLYSLATNGANGIRGLTTSVAADYQITGGGVSAVTAGNLLVNGGTITLVTGANTPGSVTLQGDGATLAGVAGTTLKIGNGNTTVPVVSQGQGNVISAPILTFGSTTAAADNEAIVYVSGSLNISSEIDNTGAGTFTGLDKSGPGELILSGPNTFNTDNSNHRETIRIENGTLTFSAANNLGAASNAIDLLHGTLHLAGTSNSTVVVTQAISLNPSSYQMDANAQIINVDSGMTLSTGNLVTGETTTLAEGFTKMGLGTLLLTGTAASNDFAQSYLVQGTLALGATGTVGANFQSNGAIMYASPGTAISYNSSADASTTLTRQGTISFNANSLSVAGNAAGNTTDQVQGGILNSGTSTITVNQGGSNTTLLNFTSNPGALTRNPGATVVFSGNALGTAATGVALVKFSVAPTGIIGGIMPYALADTTAGGEGIGFAANGSNGITPVTTTLDNNGTTQIGTVAAGTNLELNSSDIASAGTVNSLTLTGNNIHVGTGTLTVTSGGILNKGTGNHVQAATLALGAEGVVYVLSNDDLTIDSAITGSTGLTKAGAGMLTFTSASNSYSGTNWIDGGVLSVSADANLGNGGNAIVLNRGGSLRSTGTFSTSRNISVNPGGNVGIVVDGGQNLALAGSIASGLPNGISALTAPSRLGISGGGLLSLNGTVAPGLDVASGTTLGGTGTLSGGFSLASGAHGAPGNSIGTQTAATASFADGSFLDYEFGVAGANHATPGSSDSYAITGGPGSLAFPAVGSVTLNLVSGAANFVGNGSYELMSYSDPASVASFTPGDGTLGTILLGTGWDTADFTYTIADDSTNKGIFLDFTANAVPEPASLALLSLGAAALLTRRRRRA